MSHTLQLHDMPSKHTIAIYLPAHLQKAAAAFYAGANAGSGGRPDFAHYKEQELEAQRKVAELLPAHRVRPSLLQGHLAAGGYALGLLAGVAPKDVKLALIGG
jgi:demethoxyubiquinone hydroxylase (CLK1/Coq7/Cat5 family)